MAFSPTDNQLMQVGHLVKNGNQWTATLYGYRITVTQQAGQWTAQIRGRHYLQDRATLSGPTIQDVAAQARKWIETAIGNRRD
jgi:hypothetical protein